MSIYTLPRRYDYTALSAFALTAVASIFLQNLFIWLSIALFLFFHLKKSKNINWPLNLFTIATLIFLATFFIGAIVGINPAKSFETLYKYLTFLIIFPVGAMVLSTIEIRKLLYFFTAGASICAAYGIIYKHFILRQDRIDSFSGDKMVFAGLLMAGLLIVIFLLNNSLKNPWLWLSLGLIGTALVLTETRGAWVGALVGFLFLMWRLNKTWLFTGIGLLIVLFFVLPREYQDRIKSIPDLHYSYNENNMNDPADNGKVRNATNPRLIIWISGLRMFKDFPWGIGQGNVEDLYPQYRFRSNDLEPTVPHLHNNFLQLAVQNGWLGLVAYLFWIFSFYFESLRFKSTNTEAYQQNWMFLCVFSAVLVWGLAEYTFSHQFMNVQFFLLGLQINLWKTKIN